MDCDIAILQYLESWTGGLHDGGRSIMKNNRKNKYSGNIQYSIFDFREGGSMDRILQYGMAWWWWRRFEFGAGQFRGVRLKYGFFLLLFFPKISPSCGFEKIDKTNLYLKCNNDERCQVEFQIWTGLCHDGWRNFPIATGLVPWTSFHGLREFQHKIWNSMLPWNEYRYTGTLWTRLPVFNIAIGDTGYRCMVPMVPVLVGWHWYQYRQAGQWQKAATATTMAMLSKFILAVHVYTTWTKARGVKAVALRWVHVYVHGRTHPTSRIATDWKYVRVVSRGWAAWWVTGLNNDINHEESLEVVLYRYASGCGYFDTRWKQKAAELIRFWGGWEKNMNLVQKQTSDFFCFLTIIIF